MREKLFENKVKKYIRDSGGWVVKFFANSYTPVGIPDLLICYKGMFLALEIKNELGHASDIQKYQIQKIREAGGLSCVLRPQTFDDFRRLLENGDYEKINDMEPFTN